MKMVQGRGQYLYDELGNEYLDCINNVAHVGHGNKRVLEAVSKQLSLLNTNSRKQVIWNIEISVTASCHEMISSECASTRPSSAIHY